MERPTGGRAPTAWPVATASSFPSCPAERLPSGTARTRPDRSWSSVPGSGEPSSAGFAAASLIPPVAVPARGSTALACPRGSEQAGVLAIAGIDDDAGYCLARLHALGWRRTHPRVGNDK